MMKKQHKKLANELRGLTFVPNLSRTAKQNKKLVQEYEPLYKRYNFVTEMSNIKRTKMEQQTRTAELAECSFQPDIRESSKNTERRKTKVWERCIKFGLEKDKWAQQRREIINRIEEQSLTFSPTLTPKTSEIYEQMKRDGRAIRPEDRKRRTFSPEKEADRKPFSPKINHRSDRLSSKRQDQSVYERLYQAARSSEKNRREIEGKYFDDYVRNIPKPCSARDNDLPAEFENMALSGTERSELRERFMERGVGGVADSPASYVYVGISLCTHCSNSFIYFLLLPMPSPILFRSKKSFNT